MKHKEFSYRDVDILLDTIYTSVVNISARPNPQSILQGHWARFIFISGRLCIDFMQTGGETGIRAAWESLHQPTDLADWFCESPLQLRGILVSPDEFKTALALRESIWRVAQAVRQKETSSAQHIEIINQIAAGPDLPPQLTSNGFERTWDFPTTATAVLSTIARDAIDLFSGELRSRIRQCANPNCGLMFVDTSRPGKRRWCLMKRCGNMAKTSRYRHKHS